jgi:hypothetical protein
MAVNPGRRGDVERGHWHNQNEHLTTGARPEYRIDT